MNVRKRIDLLFVIFFVSGFSGLIYESVWSHYVKLFLGHAAYAQTLVLVVFIGGLALGAWIVSRLAERLRNPLRLYAMVELATGILGLLFHGIFSVAIDWGYATLLPTACEQSSAFCPAQWGLAAALLAPQSILLGATFPLMSSAVLRLSNDQPGHDIASLYFLNSLGAVLGVLASAFLLIPTFGLPGALHTAGTANVVLAAAAWFLSSVAPPSLAIAPVQPPADARERDSKRLLTALLATALLTGLSSFIYEIAWIRMLSLVLGASTYSFELMLATFILGLALGGLWVRRYIDKLGESVRFLAFVQIVMGISAAATIPLYNGAFDLMAWTLSSVSRSEGGFVIFNLTSTLIAILVMLPATFCAGMTLPLITYRLLRSQSGERALGLVYAVNTLGSIAGVIVAVHLLLRALGLNGTLLVGAAIDVLLGVALLVWMRAPGRRIASLAPALAGLVAFAVAASVFQIDPRRSASGVFRTGGARLSLKTNVIYHRDGKTATVDVVDEEGFRLIRTNGKSDASITMREGRGPSKDEYTMVLLGALPLGHRPDAKSAALIGFGSGLSTSVILSSPTIQRVDTVEIEPSMVEGAKVFRPFVDAAFDDPRSHIVIDDAKSYFARGRNRYDIIVSEPSNPWVSGVSSLFTEEFYARLATYLNDGGVLSQWLHTYEMDTETLSSILAAVSKTFPEFTIYTSIDADIIIIARKGGPAGSFDASVMQYPKLKPLLDRLEIKEPRVIQRRAVTTWSTVRGYVETYGNVANSDYFPIVDQRTSKTRFTQVRADDILALQTSPMPLLEFAEPALRPSAKRDFVIPATYMDNATNEAWSIHDMILGIDTSPSGPFANLAEINATLIRHWGMDCTPDIPFDRILPMLVNTATRMNPRLPPEEAIKVWSWVRSSKCGKMLKSGQALWLELFAAVSMRDAGQMAKTGVTLLEGVRGQRSEIAEYAFLAATVGRLCTGDPRGALALMQQPGDPWVRGGHIQMEIRYFGAMLRRPASTCPGAQS
jgi:predicted membrane-bound spermidine synthase